MDTLINAEKTSLVEAKKIYGNYRGRVTRFITMLNEAKQYRLELHQGEYDKSEIQVRINELETKLHEAICDYEEVKRQFLARLQFEITDVNGTFEIA